MVYSVFRDIITYTFRITVACLSFLCKSLMCGIHKKIYCQLLYLKSKWVILYRIGVSSSCCCSFFMECSLWSSLVVLHLAADLKCIKQHFPRFICKRLLFHEFINFNQYIVCLFNKILPTDLRNKNVCIICIKN